ncbi:MAG TPA: B12-binding domain-containing radical SAM protein [Candidatus Acidoferrum sp.]|nr:B12-binding domain-containing radical SAM protein [Candidatus Acidoferrum sp.]
MPDRLLIIQPSHYRSKADRSVFRVRRRNVVPLTLPYLAALTPPDWEIKLIDEQLQPLDFDGRADVVAITTTTLTSFRAYDIADEFRRRGVPVILGGPHTFFYGEEAAAHGSAIGPGEGEHIWRQMLEDARAGRLKQSYQAELLPDLAGLPVPRYDLLDMRPYSWFSAFTIVSSRGCPFHCEFCSERLLLGDRYRCRPVPEVIAEIKRCGARNIFFGDSNFGGKRSHAMELMEALVPLKLRWSALWSSYLCNDEPFLDLAKRSGLLHVNIGLESINPQTLDGMNKRFNKTDKYADMFANLRRRGISYSLNFIFGWDGEAEGAFDATLEFLMRHKVPAAYFNILTPVKGTALYDRMNADGRITDLANVDRWPGQVCYIRPPYGTAGELERNVENMYRRFYRWRSMLARLPMPITQANIASWVINISQLRLARAGSAHNDFDGY